MLWGTVSRGPEEWKRETTVIAYHALLGSQMSYGLSACEDTSNSNLEKVLVLQNIAVRTIKNVGYISSHTASNFLSSKKL